ncbi:hypothetical protein Scep_029806 [Stephania cephalantha]|uniref:Uncharacterized protein n=1 Tax=Stephania cephalantha TaxID=152367 RepID=A0AAP0DYD5_9MAGN
MWRVSLPKDVSHGLGSVGRKKRRYGAPGASTSQTPDVVPRARVRCRCGATTKGYEVHASVSWDGHGRNRPSSKNNHHHRHHHRHLMTNNNCTATSSSSVTNKEASGQLAASGSTDRPKSRCILSGCCPQMEIQKCFKAAF